VPFITAIDFYLLFVVGLIRLASWLPPKTRLRFVSAVAFTGYHLSKTKRRLSEEKLSQAFGGNLTKERRRTIVQSAFYQFWLEAFSISSPSFANTGRVQEEVRGLEHLRQALDHGKGAILWESGYFGRKFLAKQILQRNGFTTCQVYNENHAGGFYTPCPASWIRRRVIKGFFDKRERRSVAEILNLPLWEPLPVMRALFARLKQNHIICVAGDGTLGWNMLEKAFLGGARAFSTGMISLSRVSGAPVLPLFCVQEAPDRIAVIIEPPIEIDSKLDRESASELWIDRYIGLLESYIRKYPGQYYNWHFRSASRSNSGETSVTGGTGIGSRARRPDAAGEANGVELDALK
jgi:KDO2-lipid IV(A) lauroyltransferase